MISTEAAVSLSASAVALWTMIALLFVVTLLDSLGTAQAGRGPARPGGAFISLG